MSTAFLGKAEVFLFVQILRGFGAYFFPNLKEIVRESSFFCRKNVICYKKCVKET